MKVWYMNGAGNDFMVMDARGLQLDYKALAVEYCKITGADGFMAVDYSDTADFRLHFYNSDGSRGEMCGNGARCICRFAYDNGIAGEKMVVQTDAGLVPGMELTGTVRNVIDFGVFVDIGVHQDGLVHISEVCNRRLKHPSEVLKVGDVVKVIVLSVDEKRHRISLSMKQVKK